MRSLLFAAVLFGVALSPNAILAQSPTPGKNLLNLRGRQQEIYFYPAAEDAPQLHAKILFAPGDMGMMGLAVTIAKTMASWGYDVYALDTREYMGFFKIRSHAVKEPEVMDDFRTIIRWIAAGKNERIVLVGWSEGAGLCLLATSLAENKAHLAGLITLGMTETNSLAWRWPDLFTSIAGKPPNEPLFKSADYLPNVAPAPLLMLQASRDQYVSVDAAKRLFSVAQEPKRFRVIEARNHRFDGNQGELFAAIREGLLWTRQTSL